MSKVVSLLLCSLFFTFSLQAGGQKGLPFYKGTAHFRLYCLAEDQKASDEVLNALEENVGRIARDFKVKLKKKIAVEVHPNLKAFHERIECPQCEDWVVGVQWRGGIYMVSPNNSGPQYDYASMLKVAVHEMTHIFVAMKAPHVPKWLNEGLACYEARQLPTRSGNMIAQYAKHRGIPRFDTLEGSGQVFAYAGGYPFSYTMVEYIVDNWGFDSILSLLVHYDRFEEILGLTKPAFWKKWSDFVKQKYLKEGWSTTPP